MHWCCVMIFPQVRKYRTMTELIIDAIEYVRNPYKGKKLKVRLLKYKKVSIFNVLFFFLICHVLAWCAMSTERLYSVYAFTSVLDTSRLPKETPHSIFSLLYGEASQVCKNPSRDEQLGSHQDFVQKIQRAS